LFNVRATSVAIPLNQNPETRTPDIIRVFVPLW
jgi:hypothetical protein